MASPCTKKTNLYSNTPFSFSKKFFNELQKDHGLVAYGLNEVLRALEIGSVDMVLISENLDKKEFELQCNCGIQKKFLKSEEKAICEKCNQMMSILGEKDIIEAFEERVKQYGTKLEIISSETREGVQFEQLGGIGALLRYNI